MFEDLKFKIREHSTKDQKNPEPLSLSPEVLEKLEQIRMYDGYANDQFISKVAHNVEEACKLTDVGFDYVTGEYDDGGKIFRKRK